MSRRALGGLVATIRAADGARAAVGGWRLRPASTSDVVQRSWLRRGGALTGHLRGLGRVTVDVLDERVDGAMPDEAAALHTVSGAPVWMRAVALRVDGEALVVARSVTPLAASHGVWLSMRRLGSRPLADLLYHDHGVSRTRLASSVILPGHPLYRLAAALPAPDDAPASARTFAPSQLPRRLLARRSVFARKGVPLLIAECFLPALWRRPDARDGGLVFPYRC
ncbi:chorismate--pyruvate lyase family protein [Chitinasiproducens palmae]|uniref:Probable chorismate pyruvate-lyase n=1 Tax=Chitinasiproducens palmae TaxID=1770053 RepID=A0A1H2PUM8_9BURK|nr:chorismate lyase [Chitinasiproducens palmae]SDV50936.1 chorismate lyase [Chitinasiproducens palmae]